MNIRDYITSGIVESYVLGLASKKEQAEFEKLCSIYPELREERVRFECRLEQKAFTNAIEPPHDLKDKIFDTINQETAVSTAVKIISTKPSGHTPARQVPSMRWAVAASVILLAGCAVFIYLLYKKNLELQTEIAQSQKTTNTLDEKARLIEEKMLPGSSQIRQVKTVTPGQQKQATVSVYWDSLTADVYLVIRDLAKLEQDEKYNIWSVTKGRYKSLGLFDAPADHKLFLKMNDAREADSFTITIEKKDR